MNYPIKAIAVFDGKVKGTVNFMEYNNHIIIKINLSGLKKNDLHGFHVHESGDLTNSCESMCAHFNPFGKKHGCPGSLERHVGDLGNITTNEMGEASYTMYDNVIKLRGIMSNIIGRGLVIHRIPMIVEKVIIRNLQ